MYLRTWDTKTGKALAEYAIRPSGIEIPDEESGAGRLEFMRMRPRHASFSPDATRLLIAYRPDGYFFDVESGDELLKYTDDESNFVVSAAISPGGRFFATSAWGRSVETPLPGGGVRSSSARNHVVFIRRASDREVLHRILLPEGGAGPVAFGPDGKRLALGIREAGGTIRIYDVESGELVHEISGFDTAPRALAFSRDGRRLAPSQTDTSVLLWELP